MNNYEHSHNQFKNRNYKGDINYKGKPNGKFRNKNLQEQQ